MITDKLMILVMLCILVVSGPARAQHHHVEKHHHEGLHQEPREVVAGGHQEAHVHGVAELFVVLEGEQLDIELHSPAMNLLGFEHQASSLEDQAKVENTKEALADANGLFQLDSARCQLSDQEADFSSVVEESTPGDKGHHDTDYHDKHEAHDHSNIKAHYRYRCERPDQLGSLRTSIPVEFPGIESLQVQWIINGRQGAATLDNSRRHLNFR